MQFSDVVTTVTREAIVPSVSDGVLKGNVALLRILGNAKKWSSGVRMDTIFKYKKSTAGGIVPVGGTLDTSRISTRIKLQFEIQRLHKPVVIDDIELAVNEGDERVLSLLAAEMDSVKQDFTDDMGGYLYKGTSASGLSFDSILNAADDSTNFGTYGSQSRTTYSGLNGYYAASIGLLALSDLSTLRNEVEIGSEKPSFYSTTPAIWTAYEAVLQPTVQASYATNGYPQFTRAGTQSSVNGLAGDIGFSFLWFSGTPMVQDEKCTSQKLFSFNDKHFSFYGLDYPSSLGYEKVNNSGTNVEGPQAMPIPRGFNWSGLLRSVDQPAQVGHLYFVGNFFSDNPRYLGQLTGITD